MTRRLCSAISGMTFNENKDGFSFHQTRSISYDDFGLDVESIKNPEALSNYLKNLETSNFFQNIGENANVLDSISVIADEIFYIYSGNYDDNSIPAIFMYYEGVKIDFFDEAILLSVRFILFYE
jgi:hypothetical protein